MPRISQLPAITVPSNDDPLAIVDTSGAVTSKITRGDLLGGAPLPAGSVDTTQLADEAVTNAKLADKAVTPDKWTNPYRFSAYRSSAVTVPSGGIRNPIVYDTETYDPNNNYDTSTGKYTAPVDGTYSFYAYSRATATTGDIVRMTLRVNGTATKEGMDQRNNVGTTYAVTVFVAGDVQLTAGDEVTVSIQHTESYAMGMGTTDATNFFSGFLVSET